MGWYLEGIGIVTPRCESTQAEKKRVGLLQTLLSVLSAFFGVQSSRVRQRDFTSGSPRMFLIIAVAMTLALVLGLALVVRLIMAQSQVLG
tara:strand:- start:23040 stop:23309 length:270 start_codon:yes stop_codon:yes gene_type:complete